MAIFNSYVKLPEGTWEITKNKSYYYYLHDIEIGPKIQSEHEIPEWKHILYIYHLLKSFWGMTMHIYAPRPSKYTLESSQFTPEV